MGFLLVQHELLRAKAKVNALTLKQTQLTSKKDRIQKAIEKKEKFFNKQQTALENKFKNAKTNLTNAINTNNFAAIGAAFDIPTQISDLLSGQFAKTRTVPSETELKVTKEGKEYKWTNAKGEIETVDATFVGQLKMNAYAEQQNTLAQMKATYQAMMDQFLESVKEIELQALEDKKETAMLPLNEQDTEIDIEKNVNDTQLGAAEEYAKALESKMAERVKDATPKFGLG